MYARVIKLNLLTLISLHIDFCINTSNIYKTGLFYHIHNSIQIRRTTAIHFCIGFIPSCIGPNYFKHIIHVVCGSMQLSKNIRVFSSHFVQIHYAMLYVVEWCPAMLTSWTRILTVTHQSSIASSSILPLQLVTWQLKAELVLGQPVDLCENILITFNPCLTAVYVAHSLLYLSTIFSNIVWGDSHRGSSLIAQVASGIVALKLIQCNILQYSTGYFEISVDYHVKCEFLASLEHDACETLLVPLVRYTYIHLFVYNEHLKKCMHTFIK